MIDSVAISSAAAAAFEKSAAAGSANLTGAGSAGVATNAGVSETPFAGVLQEALQQIGKLQNDATTKVDGLLRGTGVDVHAAMLATERSDLAFEMTLALRSKAVSAYEQLNSMQF
jgi:flagellar hook-basal body complex protein FliE